MGLLSNVTDAAKAVFVAGQEEARSLGHGVIGTEHLVIALLDATGSAGVNEARRQGASAPTARSFVETAFASAPDSIGYVPDEQSLRAVGVDLEGVRARAEREFGAGSVPMRVGAPAFTPQVKAAIEKAVAVAGSRGRAGLDDILLGILDDAAALGARTVRAITTDVAAIEAAARRGVIVP